MTMLFCSFTYKIISLVLYIYLLYLNSYMALEKLYSEPLSVSEIIPLLRFSLNYIWQIINLNNFVFTIFLELNVYLLDLANKITFLK